MQKSNLAKGFVTVEYTFEQMKKLNDFKKHLSHIDDIVETIANENEEKEIAKENNLNSCIIANIKHSFKMIEDNPIIKEKHTKVVPMQYDVHNGTIRQL